MFKIRRNKMCPCLWRTWWQRSAKAWILLMWLFLQVCPLWLFLIHYQILRHLIYLQRSFPLSSIVYFQKKHCLFWTGMFNCEWSSNHHLFVFPGWNENTEAVQRPAESHSFPAASCQGVLTLCPPPPYWCPFLSFPGFWQLLSWPRDPRCKGQLRERWDRLDSEQWPRAAAMK